MRLKRSMNRWLILLVVASTAAEPAARAIETELVPMSASSTPFFAAADNLARWGYTEEEYFVTGTGNVYEYDSGGAVQVQTADVPYKTRVLVRRPTVARFNGVVLFEMMNPTAGHDIDFEWHYNRELLIEEGFAWVGITMKDVAIDFLRSWDAARYDTLHMADRGLAYDMFAQTGALLRDGSSPDNPLSGYDVQTVIGTGYSQTADYLTTFSNEFHEQSLTATGQHAFDGYLLGGGTGGARRINSAGPERYLDDRRFNTVEAPLIRVQSETEVVFFNSIGVRSGDPNLFRIYEIAGGSHADAEGLQRTGEVISRDRGGPILPPCGNPLSPLAIGPVHRGSLSNLVRWTQDGEPPPPNLLIELDADQVVVRDGFGNASGGVRLPPVDVPLGTYAPGNSGPLPCPVAGSFIAFDDATLDLLYPDHGAYVEPIAELAFALARTGYILRSDAVSYVDEAARSGIGR